MHSTNHHHFLQCTWIDTPKKVENATCQRGYSKDKLTTLWNRLPSLDINDTDPDLLYTVELYQITCGRNVLINQSLVASNTVTEEGLDLMQIYKAVIAARNNVREARNGPSVEMKGTCITLLSVSILLKREQIALIPRFSLSFSHYLVCTNLYWKIWRRWRVWYKGLIELAKAAVVR